MRRTLDVDGAGATPATGEYFVYDGGQLSMTFEDAALVSQGLAHRYLYGPAGQALVDEVFYHDFIEGRDKSDEVLWLLADHQGTVRDIVDSDGVLRKHVEYDSFGNVTGEAYYAEDGSSIADPATHAEAVDQLFYYTGQERDEATGLQLHGARWYDPALGRWLSEDPSGFDAGDANRVSSYRPRPFSSPRLGGLGCSWAIRRRT